MVLEDDQADNLQMSNAGGESESDYELSDADDDDDDDGGRRMSPLSVNGGHQRKRGSKAPDFKEVPAGGRHKKPKRVPLEPLENGVPVLAADDAEGTRLADPAEFQHAVVKQCFGERAPNVNTTIKNFRDGLRAAATAGLADLGEQEQVIKGFILATILKHMYQAAFDFVTEAATASDLWDDDDVDVLRSVRPPQCREDILEALASIRTCDSILLIVSKCAAGDHVALAPDGSHATLLKASERAAGEGTVVLDVAQRVFLCRRASKGGACQDLDKTSGLCAVADSAERRVAEVFLSVLIELLVVHALPEAGRLTVAVNHSGWKDALAFVLEQRRLSPDLRRALRPFIVQVAHYRYVLGEEECLHGRTHLVLGYLFAGGVASGRVGEDVLQSLNGSVINTYKEEWKVELGKKGPPRDAMHLLSEAEAMFDELIGSAFVSSAPRATCDLSSSFLHSTEQLYEINRENFSDEIARLRRWFHEFTQDDRSNGGKTGGAGASGVGCGKGPQSGPGTQAGRHGDGRTIKGEDGKTLQFEADVFVEGLGIMAFRGPVNFRSNTAYVCISKAEYKRATDRELGKEQWKPTVKEAKIKIHGEVVTKTAAVLRRELKKGDKGPVLEGAGSM